MLYIPGEIVKVFTPLEGLMFAAYVEPHALVLKPELPRIEVPPKPESVLAPWRPIGSYRLTYWAIPPV